MMWFSSPCNPSGSVTTEELTALQSVRKNTHVYVVADEIYEHINFSGTFAALHLSRNVRRTITVNGVAKAFAMTGWRIGILTRIHRQSVYKKVK
jgi:aspartate aminotransferase